MLLVLCGLDDDGALRFGRRAGAAGVDCRIVTTEELSYPTRLSHRLGGGGVHTTIELADGTVLDAGRLSGVLNRMLEPPALAWRRAVPAERDYAAMELHALMVSWLHALPCPVRNLPDPEFLAGPVRHPFLTAAAAHHSGLRCPVTRFDSDETLDPADALLGAAARAAGRPARAIHLVCLDGEVIAPIPPEGIASGVRALATELGMGEALVGVDFVVGPDGWWFAGLSPLADLRGGGTDLTDRLLDLLAPAAAQAIR